MLTLSDWFPLAAVGVTFMVLGSLKLWGLNRGIVGGAASRLFNGCAAHDPPGRAAVCG